MINIFKSFTDDDEVTQNDNMFITKITVILYAVNLLTPQCQCIKLVNLPKNEINSSKSKVKYKGHRLSPRPPKLSAKAQFVYEPYPLEEPKAQRRFWFEKDPPNEGPFFSKTKGKKRAYKTGKAPAVKIPVNYEPYALEDVEIQRRFWSMEDPTNGKINLNKPDVKNEVGKIGTKPKENLPVKYESYPVEDPKAQRKYWSQESPSNGKESPDGNLRAYENENDANLKKKISVLVQQTMRDIERKLKYVKEYHHDKYSKEIPYKVAFLLNVIEKSKVVADELFNVAVKHKQEWMALEQLKILELLLQTNLDNASMLRELNELHMKHTNMTIPHVIERKRWRV